MSKKNCNPFDGGEVPPCSELLGNSNPIIKDKELIFKNNNRVFYFISTNSQINNSTTGCYSLGCSNVQTNLQISLETFLVGLYINEVEIGNIKHNKETTIHNNEAANAFINTTLENKPDITVDYNPELIIVISNNNAILALYTNVINISPLNYYILFILNRLENHPGLFFGNNSYATEDEINFTLAELAIRFPFE
ncbi:MAG: hypothetical protein MR510_05080 [Clostridium sp.]|uniref:hypothetical protein n=1 Tax=Clostridium sp. TaxID=1506 RepID=UPI0025C61EE1|nr:hypothetical protein [Clostridium sp.]MCI6691841.1 hypothetical protein [Clostridium sp.]MDY2630787.1 hypothetical protein [Clostridium sp.]MDY6227016.1 hypothetical protein [Clostridium sp.]